MSGKWVAAKGEKVTITIGNVIVTFKVKENVAIFGWDPMPPCKFITLEGLYFVDQKPQLFTLTLKQMEKKGLIEEVSVKGI